MGTVSSQEGKLGAASFLNKKFPSIPLGYRYIEYVRASTLRRHASVSAQTCRFFSKWARFDYERMPQLIGLLEKLLVDSGAATANVNHLFVVVYAQRERAEVFALSAGHAADDKILLGDEFDFEPGVAAFGFIAAGGVLGDNTFQLMLARELQERFAVAGIVLGVAHSSVRPNDGLQDALAFGERRVAQVVSVEVEQIKDKVIDRPASGQLSDRAGHRADARLQQGKAGMPLAIERDDFPIENRGLGGNVLLHPCEFRILPFDAGTFSRGQPYGVTACKSYGADSVPFEFEEPVRPLRQSSPRSS